MEVTCYGKEDSSFYPVYGGIYFIPIRSDGMQRENNRGDTGARRGRTEK